MVNSRLTIAMVLAVAAVAVCSAWTAHLYLPAEYPNRRQVHQQIGGLGAIPIRGFYPSGPYPNAVIEARWAGGPWTVIAPSPAWGVFSGNLVNQPIGWGTVQVRIQGGPMLYDIPDVGVGDVYVIAGQSNAVMLTETQRVSTWPSSTLMVSPPTGMLFKPTADPLHEPTWNGQPIAWGSVWPLLSDAISDATGMPVMFVATAEPATGLVNTPDWQGALRTRLIENVRVATSGKMCVRAILWHQGERDANGGVSTAAYKSALIGFIEGLHSSFLCEVPLVSAVLGAPSLAPASTEAIRVAQRQAAVESSLVLPGPETVDLPTLDGVHLSDAAVPTLLERWCVALADFYGGTPPCQLQPPAPEPTCTWLPPHDQTALFQVGAFYLDQTTQDVIEVLADVCVERDGFGACIDRRLAFRSEVGNYTGGGTGFRQVVFLQDGELVYAPLFLPASTTVGYWGKLPAECYTRSVVVSVTDAGGVAVTQ